MASERMFSLIRLVVLVITSLVAVAAFTLALVGLLKEPHSQTQAAQITQAWHSALWRALPVFNPHGQAFAPWSSTADARVCEGVWRGLVVGQGADQECFVADSVVHKFSVKISNATTAVCPLDGAFYQFEHDNALHCAYRMEPGVWLQMSRDFDNPDEGKERQKCAAQGGDFAKLDDSNTHKPGAPFVCRVRVA